MKLAEGGPQVRLDPFGDEEGELVLRCPGMSAEDKLAWSFLRHRSGWGHDPSWDWEQRTFKITAADLAEHQRVDAASGRRRRANLADRWQLIRVHHRCNVSGAWTVSLVRPSVALGEALGLVAADPQPRLTFPELLESAEQATSESTRDGAGDAPACSADLPQAAAEPFTEPPRPPLTSGHQTPSVSGPDSLDMVIGNTSDHPLRVSIAKDRAASHRGGTVHGNAGASCDEDRATDDLAREVRRRQQQLGIRADDAGEPLALNRVAAVAAAIVQRLPDERSVSMARERWIALIKRRVNDPQLKDAPCVKVAAAIAEGRLKESYVAEVFAELDKQRRNGTLRSAGAYFVGSCQRLFSRLGLEWAKPKPR